jgi:IclR family KDG regulon transcriptional repressor
MDKTFVKGLTLLELLARSAGPKGVSEIARELGLTKSNVHRLLMTLQARDYVRKVPHNSAYELTSKLWEIGALVRSRLDITKVSREAMIELESATGESVHLSIMDGREVVYVDKLEGSHPIKAYTTIGGRAPAWCVATGKALLAHASPEIVEDVASHLTRFTERTIVNRDDLLENLQTIRKTGYATNQGEWREGVAGVAAPVRDSSGYIVAAIGISGPAMRFRQKDVRSRAAVVMRAAASISAALGYRPTDRQQSTEPPRRSTGKVGRQ